MQASKRVRRSVVLPRQLVEQASGLAHRDLRGNFNRLVTVALEEFTRRRKAETFERAMAEMAHDPAIRTESAAIQRQFAAADADGISDD